MTEFHLGFTGCEAGMSAHQWARVEAWTRSCRDRCDDLVAHHGDCVGSDEQFHRICLKLGGIRLWIHPPSDPSRRAFCRGAQIVLPEKPYLARNRDIARASAALLATPEERQEVLRSGTWATVRAAVRLGREVVILTPTGGTATYDEVRMDNSSRRNGNA